MKRWGVEEMRQDKIVGENHCTVDLKGQAEIPDTIITYTSISHTQWKVAEVSHNRPM